MTGASVTTLRTERLQNKRAPDFIFPQFFLFTYMWWVIKRHPWVCVMAIDAGKVFERDSVEPLLDEISVHAVDDFCSLFCVSAGHIKFRKADDLKAIFSGGGIQNLAGFSVTVGCISIGG